MDVTSTQQLKGETMFEKGRKTLRHQLMIAPVGAGMILIGIHFAWSSMGPFYLKEINISMNKQQVSWMGSLLPLGAVLGTLPVGILADKYGRKLIAWISTLPLWLSWFILFFVDHLIAIYVARFVAGIGCGAASVAIPLYFYEIADESNQRHMVRAMHFLFNVGIFLSNIVEANKAIMMSILLNFFVTIPILMVPESPKWLEAQGLREEAEKVIKKLSSQDVKLDPTKPVKSIDHSGLRLASLKAISNRRDVFLILGLVTLQQISGICVFTFYTSDYITRITRITSPSRPFSMQLYIMLLPIMAAYFVGTLVRRVGEKHLLTTGTCSMAILSFLLAAYNLFLGYPDFGSVFHAILVILVLTYLSMYHISLGPVPWIMIGKMFPSSTRNTVYNLALTCGWASLFIATKTFYDMLTYMEMYIVLIVYGFINLIGAIIICFAIPKDIKEVEEDITENLDDVNMRLTPTCL